jgi:flavin-dependent dehydrogenase
MRVAIVGAGPAGTTLATLLAQQGVDTFLFDSGQRPALTVGESLVPALVPILRRLGIEGRIADTSCVKPGVSFHWSDEDRLRFSFQSVAHCLPPYAYNVHRDDYDAILLDTARRAGARIVSQKSELERAGAESEIRLGASTQAPTGSDDVDLIVDASGRARLVTKLLGIPARHGARNDVAHFAHFTGVSWHEIEGQVVINRIRDGWSWRIPLRDRVSIGVVAPRDVAHALGATPEARLMAALQADDELNTDLAAATRVSPVMTYSNYQLWTTRGHGPGWAAIGDAFGFVDPMLSPGVYLAQRSAELLVDHLRAADALSTRAIAQRQRATTSACLAYERDMTRLLSAWRELIESFYDGSMMALYRAGRGMVADRQDWVSARIQNHIERQVATMATGAATTSRYSRGLLRFLRRFALRGLDPRDFAITASEKTESHDP